MTQGRIHRLVAFAPVCLLTSFGLFYFSRTVADPDLWGHVRFGQDILRTGRIIQRDPYSYRTGDQPWINHEWLAEVIFAGLYDRGGSAGLIAFKVVISLLLLWLGYVRLRAPGLGRYSAVLVLLLVSVPLRMGLGTVRPQMFTYLFFLVLLVVLSRAAVARPIWLSIIPVLFAVWVNVHGGVLAGVGVLFLWIVGLVVDYLRLTGLSKRVSLLVAVAIVPSAMAAGMALLLNPYGAGLIRFLLRTATVPRPEISEWTALGLRSVPGLLYLALIVTAGWAMAFSRRGQMATGLLVLGATAVMTAISSRHLPLFALAVVVVSGADIAAAWNRMLPAAWLRLGQSVWLAVLSMVLSMVLAASSLPRFGCIWIEASYFPFPARVVELLRQSGAPGNMAVAFDWGEYVLWHLGPHVKVSIDGRRETVYSGASYRQSVDFARGTGDWYALLRAGRTDLVLLPNGARAARFLSSDDHWIALYQDTFCTLFVRAGYPGLEQIMATRVPRVPDNGDGLCFPGPGGERRRAAGFAN